MTVGLAINPSIVPKLFSNTFAIRQCMLKEWNDASIRIMLDDVQVSLGLLHLRLRACLLTRMARQETAGFISASASERMEVPRDLELSRKDLERHEYRCPGSDWKGSGLCKSQFLYTVA
jgi:hypothetical protein